MRMLRFMCLVTAVSAWTSPQQLSSSSSSLSPLEIVSSQRRSFLIGGAAVAAAFVAQPPPAQAVGPVKVQLLNPVYTALPCPPSKPIPGEKAMKGLRGLCVTVKADLAEAPSKVCLCIAAALFWFQSLVFCIYIYIYNKMLYYCLFKC
jgi:hypothetical protein